MTSRRIVDEQTLNHDDFAWKLARSLLEDFKPFLSGVFHDAANEAISLCSVEKLRGLTSGKEDSYQPYQMKTERQILDLFKKFSFSQDLRTPAELRDDSIKKFMDNQERLSNFCISTGKTERSILFGARGYADKILGDFSELEICERATFGKKSSVGIPMRKACESERYEAPITGSCEHIAWYDRYYSVWNRPGANYSRKRAELFTKPPYRVIDTLEAVLVDKTWKSLRMIMPNTTLGTLYSSGLGRTIEDRLRAFGYDIKHLQPVHGVLAKFGSITGSLVTADQSMASDNITVQLVDAILPRRWAQALKFGRIEEIALYGKQVKTPTFSTMGIGFTFPLQTLVFLCLLLSIRDHLELDEQTVVSVFGDDLIYDSRMHSTVVDVFPGLGLVLNLDKTFAEGNFRESCGFDFFRGIDVRPFHLKRASTPFAGKRRAEAYLYTAVNGLLRRWECYEIPLTLRFLVEEIRRIRKDEVLLVPTDYPDTSGVKASPETAFLMGIERKVKWRNASSAYHFRYLAFEPDLKEEQRHEPLLFLALRNPVREMCLPFDKVKYPIRRMVGVVIEDSPPLLKEVDDPNRGSYRHKTTGKRLRHQLTMIPEKDRGRYRERPGVAGNWTPDTQGKLPN